MTEKERQQIKSALLQCADENEGKGYVNISNICRDAVKCITELEAYNEKLLNSGIEKYIAELRSIIDFQTSSNMDRYFQLKRNEEKLARARRINESIIDNL